MKRCLGKSGKKAKSKLDTWYSSPQVLVKIGEVHFVACLAPMFFMQRHKRHTNCRQLALWSEPQKISLVVWQTTSENCSKKRTARAARLIFRFVQQTKSLTCDVVVADVVVISENPQYQTTADGCCVHVRPH